MGCLLASGFASLRFAQGLFFGLSHENTRTHAAYAVLEGVAFGLADGLDALRAAGTQVQQLSLVGGGSRSAFWAQLIADVLNVEIVVHTGSEAGGALGAARLGACRRTASRPTTAAWT